MKAKRLIGILVLGLGLTLALLAGLQMAQATPAATDLFVKPTGGGSACSQAAPCTLQTALSQAVDGDTIYVAGGVYTSSEAAILKITRSITVYGGWDGTTSGSVVRDPQAYPAILDGENVRRVVYMSPLVSPTLEGLTLQQGNAAGQGGDPGIPGADAGGAVYAYDASPTISNCHILSSTAGFGAGLALYRGTPTVANSVIADNVAIQSIATLTRGVGGGMLLYQSGGVVAGNLVANNVASGTQMYDGGGGLYLDGSTALVRSNTIQGNRGPNGGGLFIYLSAAIVRDNAILSNFAGTGGGVLLASSPANFEANIILGNASLTMGGGFAIFDSVTFTLTNNVVAQNHGAYPAGLFAGASFPGLSSQGVLIHNTFADNPSAPNPWTIHLGQNASQPATLVFTNNIVGLPGGIYVNTGSTAVLDTTLWDKIPIGVEANGPGTIVSSTNLYGNAGFVGPTYHLGTGSPAIDQGANAGVTIDIDGEARPNGPKPDIGADEFYCHALTGVSVAGPTMGITDTAITFTAIVSPLTATPYITYTWQASGQSPITHTIYQLSDTEIFTWTVVGPQTVTVTAVNCGGSGVGVHVITIAKWRIYLPIILRN